MDELEISGKRYISSRRAAKEHRYHSDYIGQLIRGKKVVGQKVGRSWYVEAESLDKYLRGEGMVQIAAEVAPTPAPVVAPVVLPVAPPPPPVVEEKKVEEPAPLPPPASEVVTFAPVVEKSNIVLPEEKPIAINITKTDTPTRKGLTYLADDTPLFPAIKKARDAGVVVVEETPVEEEIEEEIYEEAPAPRQRSSFVGATAVFFIGVLTFLGMSVAAYGVNYFAVVDGEESTASVTIGFK